MSLIVIGALAVTGALALVPVNFLGMQTPAFSEPPAHVQVPDSSASSGADVAQNLTYPAMTFEQSNWMTEVQEAVEDDPNYTSMAISLDRKSVSVTWYGAASPELEALLAAGPPDTELSLIPSPYPGGQLRALQDDAWQQEFDGFRIVSSSVNLDGSGILFDVVSESATVDQTHDDIVAVIGSGEIPVIVNLVPGDPIAF